MTSFHADERGIVASWLIKVVVGIALVGLVFVEGGSIIFTKLKVQDTAESGANAGITYLTANPGECTAAGELGIQAVLDKDPRVKVLEYACLPDGQFRITVQKRAATILVGRISATKDWALARSTASARPAVPGV
jgi:Flp pilus assembly protein TadG